MTMIRKAWHIAAEAAIAAVVLSAAFVWKSRAFLIDLAGGACLTVAAALVTPAAGWAVLGVWLTVQAYGIERKAKP